MNQVLFVPKPLDDACWRNVIYLPTYLKKYRSLNADLFGRIGEEGAEFPLAGVDWAIGGFWGEEGAGVVPVLMVKGGSDFIGDDSRDVSEKSVVSLTYPSSKSLGTILCDCWNV